ncbi:TetR family transcriptional regulator [Paenibacillus sp. CF384]|uniref:TetR family transcriptional regulator n=1 Tax=Paenibacillus sp. CF384 TaxID=1884382 RepID=UPI0008948A6F|nr:TetR family transcriptional regulator [Paenibacillus sp. CF384]SDX58038.1 transcriptional regulator, TetR family [Paenibacillus sp. CF384]
MTERKEGEKQSFITEARRTQIMNAAITTLDEIGYVNASLAQIAKRAGISTALISYHFKDKNDLMDHTLMMLVQESSSYVLNRTATAATATEKLRAYIYASIAYQGTRPQHNTALIEIVFHARTPDNVPYYKIGDDEDDPMLARLQQILFDGQAAGEFCAFNVLIMASTIQGAIGEYLVNPNLIAQVDMETYSAELVRTFERAILASPSA